MAPKMTAARTREAWIEARAGQRLSAKRLAALTRAAETRGGEVAFFAGLALSNHHFRHGESEPPLRVPRVGDCPDADIGKRIGNDSCTHTRPGAETGSRREPSEQERRTRCLLCGDPGAHFLHVTEWAVQDDSGRNYAYECARCGAFTRVNDWR